MVDWTRFDAEKTPYYSQYHVCINLIYHTSIKNTPHMHENCRKRLLVMWHTGFIYTCIHFHFKNMSLGQRLCLYIC